MTDREAICKLAGILRDAIVELGEVPAGHLYARLMGSCTLEQFNRLIDAMVGARMIGRTGDLLHRPPVAVNVNGRRVECSGRTIRMFSAFRRDVLEHLEAQGVDVNNPDATECDGKKD